MPIDAIITLDQLSCSKESDGTGHSEPYLWPVLLRVDDETLATPPLLSSLHPAEQFARAVVKQNMKRGDSAPVPQGQRSFTFRFSDNLKLHNVILIVALLEEDETPDRAVKAGYISFRNEVPKAVGTLDRLLRLSSTDPAVVNGAIAEVKAQVTDAVRAAIKNRLTATEKLGVLLGTLNLDDQIAVSHLRFDQLTTQAGATLDQAFSVLLVRKPGASNSTITDQYTLSGRFQTRRVLRDRCQARADAVKAAQDEVDSIQREIDEARGLPGGQVLVAQLKEDLEVAQATLDAARAALAQCRAGGVVVGGTDIVVSA